MRSLPGSEEAWDRFPRSAKTIEMRYAPPQMHPALESTFKKKKKKKKEFKRRTYKKRPQVHPRAAGWLAGVEGILCGEHEPRAAAEKVLDIPLIRFCFRFKKKMEYRECMYMRAYVWVFV
jgi:hypothetical protein